MASPIPDAQSIASAVDIAGSGRISLAELTAYFAGVNAKYGRDSNGSKEAAAILTMLNPSGSASATEASCSVGQFAQYLSDTFRKYPDKLKRLLPIAQQVRERRLASAAVATSADGVKALPPPWLTGQMEAPAGTKDMGGWTRGVFTAEQQARLGVTEEGQKLDSAGATSADGVKALPPPWLTGQMEAPAGTKDMGGWTRGVFTAEQQARLGVTEEGQKLDSAGAASADRVKALPPPWLTGQMEAPAGTKDMGGWTRGVFTAEQQARLGVTEEGQKLDMEGAAENPTPATNPPTTITAPAPAPAVGGNFVGGPATSTPPWVRGDMEAPAGTKDMGGWTRGVYTAEQQARLSVDENGQTTIEAGVAAPASHAPDEEPTAGGLQPLPPPWLTGQKEAPAGTKDMGGWTISVFTAEQQARLGVSAEGQKVVAPPASAAAAAAPAEAASAEEAPAEPTEAAALAECAPAEAASVEVGRGEAASAESGPAD
jgi:hypothetical protein